MTTVKVAKKAKLRKTDIKQDDYVDLNKEIIMLPNGVRLTNEMAQKWADELEARPIGRPSLSGESEVSPEIKARVPRLLKEKLEKIAEAEGVNLSAIIRTALFEYTSNHFE